MNALSCRAFPLNLSRSACRAICGISPTRGVLWTPPKGYPFGIPLFIDYNFFSKLIFDALRLLLHILSEKSTVKPLFSAKQTLKSSLGATDYANFIMCLKGIIQRCIFFLNAAQKVFYKPVRVCPEETQ